MPQVTYVMCHVSI